MRFVPTTEAEKREMLASLGAASIEELFADIPAGLRLKDELDLPPAMYESELTAHLRSLAGRNADLENYACFMGGGVYDRLVPAALSAVASRAEFVTAYTPYQAEISQGVLQAIYEYQTFICQLTGLDVANASVYDGATACAEAALMAVAHTGRRAVLVTEGLHPEYRRVVETYLRPQGLELITVPQREDGQADMAALEALSVGKKAAGLIAQQPNFFGCLEPMAALAQTMHEAGGLFIACVEPVSLGILASPGSYGADIAVGEGQSLGNPVSFGGPLLGFMAAKQDLLRRLPGRIVGATVDKDGRRGFVLTLQAREQHIRREKASSNICSNQALNVLYAAVYLALAGKEGLKEAANLSVQKAHYLYKRLTALPGWRPAFSGPFFNEFCLAVDERIDWEQIERRLLEQKIIGGLPLGRLERKYEGLVLFCVTEARTRAEMDRLVEIVAAM